MPVTRIHIKLIIHTKYMLIKNKTFHLHSLIPNIRANKLYIVLNFIVQAKVNYIKYPLAQQSAILACKTTVFKFTTNLSRPLNLNLYKVTTTLRRFSPVSNNFLYYKLTIRKYGFTCSKMLTYPVKLEEVQYNVIWLRNVRDLCLWC